MSKNKENLETIVDTGNIIVVKVCTNDVQWFEKNARRYGKDQLMWYRTDPFQKTHAPKYSLLCSAAANGCLEMCEFLLKNNVDPNYNNGNPLYLAIVNGHHQIARLLIQNGCDVNNCDSQNGETIGRLVDICIENGKLELLKILKTGGLKLNHSKGYKYLEHAAGKDYIDSTKIIKFLCKDCGIDINSGNDAALANALKLGKIETLRFLITECNVNIYSFNPKIEKLWMNFSGISKIFDIIKGYKFIYKILGENEHKFKQYADYLKDKYKRDEFIVSFESKIVKVHSLKYLKKLSSFFKHIEDETDSEVCSKDGMKLKSLEMFKAFKYLFIDFRFRDVSDEMKIFFETCNYYN